MVKRVPRSGEADYVVVGSGSSGAAIAGRLAEAGASVIVLEAGKTDENLLVRKPGMIGPLHSVPQLKKLVDWGFYSEPQKHLLNRRMPVPRGKVVGGSSSVNGMVYVRGNRANYDSWAAEGNAGWDADSVNTCTSAWRTSRTARTRSAAPAGRSASPATRSPRKGRCSSSRPPPTRSAARSSTTTTHSRRRV